MQNMDHEELWSCRIWIVQNVWLHRIWIVQNLDHAEFECAKFGSSNTWIVQNLDRAELGLCSIWIMQYLDCKKFGLCRIWIMQDLDHAEYGLCRWCRIWIVNIWITHNFFYFHFFATKLTLWFVFFERKCRFVWPAAH